MLVKREMMGKEQMRRLPGRENAGPNGKKWRVREGQLYNEESGRSILRALPEKEGPPGVWSGY